MIGHPPVSGTKENVGQVLSHLTGLMAAVASAPDQGMADNSPEIVDAVRAPQEPDYGDWNNFADWLPMNVEGVIRVWTEMPATPVS